MPLLCPFSCVYAVFVSNVRCLLTIRIKGGVNQPEFLFLLDVNLG